METTESNTTLKPGSRFEGKVALVTGGGTGMGRSTALLLAAEGSRVVVSGRRPGPLEEVVSAIAAAGGQALAVPADVTKPAQVEALVARTLKHFGALDIAFNNAGILGDFGPLADMSHDAFDNLIATNLSGVFSCLRGELRAMRKAGAGAIVNTSSWTAHGAMPGIAAYAATKGALDAMMRTVAAEVGELGIRINNVCPGIIATPMLDAAFGDDADAAAPFAQHTPLRRVGQPEDVAGAVAWLLSDEARFVTGQTLLVDGGYTLGGLRPWMSDAVTR